LRSEAYSAPARNKLRSSHPYLRVHAWIMDV
jgi:hypothetical protein